VSRDNTTIQVTNLMKVLLRNIEELWNNVQYLSFGESYSLCAEELKSILNPSGSEEKERGVSKLFQFKD